MAIVGALENGLTGSYDTLKAKSIIDGISSIVFASSLGVGEHDGADTCLLYTSFISYLGLDTNASLKSQTVNATAASMMGVEEGSSWHDYSMDNTVKQMTMVQRGLKQAQEEGYQLSLIHI